MRIDSGTTQGRDRKREREEEEKAIALCNQLSLRLFLAFFLCPRAFLLCCFIDPSPRAGKVEGKSCL